MKERPVLFSGPMIRALLAGRKTQTRRIVNIETLAVTLPRLVRSDIPGGPFARLGRHAAALNQNGAVSVRLANASHIGVKPSEFDFVCPYADGVTRIRSEHRAWEIVPHPGQRLWVRETWRAEELESDGRDGVRFAADDHFQPIENDLTAAAQWVQANDNGRHAGHWRPSIFMPRWACRIVLEVASVRVQRLQDISEEDARAEGLTTLSKDGRQTFKWGIPDRDGWPGNVDDGWHWHEWSVSARDAYARLWDAINKRRAPWASNPFVWVVEFRVVQPQIKSHGCAPEQSGQPTTNNQQEGR